MQSFTVRSFLWLSDVGRQLLACYFTTEALGQGDGFAVGFHAEARRSLRDGFAICFSPRAKGKRRNTTLQVSDISYWRRSCRAKSIKEKKEKKRLLRSVLLYGCPTCIHTASPKRVKEENKRGA